MSIGEPRGLDRAGKSESTRAGLARACPRSLPTLDRADGSRSDPSAMKSDVRAIPPAPRRIRLRPLFAHRWPLLGIGGPLVVLGALLAWAMFLQSGGKFSLGPALDAGPVRSLPGTVLRVEGPRVFAAAQWDDVRYEFEWPNAEDPLRTRLYGGSFLPRGRVQAGEPITVQALISDPNINRARGGMLHIDRDWLHAKFWAQVMVVPGALLLLGWLAGAFQLRRVLVHGDVSIGTVHRVRLVPFVLPQMLAVDFTFRDHRAIARHARHWVRAHGPIGARLARSQNGEYELLPVLFDRQVPQWSRILIADDFLPSPPTDTSTLRAT